jgi:cytochrome b subunit of formate dehydrogenase
VPPAKPTVEEPVRPVVVKLPPPKGSHIPVDKISCVTCHTEPGIWDEKTKHLFHSREKLNKDIHFQNGVNCQDCHGGNYESDDVKAAHAQEDGFRSKAEDIRKFCVVCHKDNTVKLTMSVHAKAGERDDRGAGTRMACEKCHGDVSHQTRSVHDKESPVYWANQVKTCGDCHPDQLATYNRGVHGPDHWDLHGLGTPPGCADCHGSHGIYDAGDRRSTLHPTRVAATCGKCHHDIEEKLRASVHATAGGPGGIARRTAPGAEFRDNGKRKPSCTDCHQGHDQPGPETLAFRQLLPDRCGNCHNALSSSYALTIHGELTGLGYGPAAKCSDCHGSHGILAVSNPNSTLSPANRAATCGKCHPHASGNFLNFDPHVDHLDPLRGGIVRWTYLFFLTMLIATFGCFGLHSVLWFLRSLVDVFKHGRPRGLRAGQAAYVRFTARHRWGHVMLLISFLGLAATGLPLKYNHSAWGKNLAAGLGGFSWTGTWHRFFAITTFACLAMYAGLLAWRYFAGRRQGAAWQKVVFGPDSPVPTWRDVRDFFRMVRWFLGLGPKPTFERWSYWEKFDFWGACADIVIIGLTGLILWFPNFFCHFLPGVGLNIAKVIHSTQALLATGFVFAIHFFNTHLRPEKFPADMSVLSGLVSEEEMREERPELMERLAREGDLDRLRTVLSRRRIWRLRAYRILGFIALALGLALLAGMVVVGMGG